MILFIKLGLLTLRALKLEIQSIIHLMSGMGRLKILKLLFNYHINHSPMLFLIIKMYI